MLKKQVVMKRLLALIILMYFINSCDDGNVTVQNISFESIDGAACNSIVYKIKNNEIMFVQIADFAAAFLNDQTLLNQPRVLNIGNGNAVSYRSYNGLASAANICSSPPATKPDVIEEWTATGGTIEITTTINKSVNTTTNATTIAGYNHFIVFKNITFSKPNGIQFYDVFNFGFYKTTLTTQLNVNFPTNFQVCTSGTNNIISNRIGNGTLISYANVPNNINNTVGVKTAAISATNPLYYRLFSALDTNSYLCSSTFTAAANTLTQEWTATSGTVEIKTETSGPTSFKHTLTLKNVNLARGNSTFYLGDSFSLGEYLN